MSVYESRSPGIMTFTYECGGGMIEPPIDRPPTADTPSASTYTYEAAVDHSIGFNSQPHWVAGLEYAEAELRVRVPLDGDATATWIFAATPVTRYARPIELLSNLRARLRSVEFLPVAIIDNQEKRTRYTVDDARRTITVTGPDGRATVYPLTGDRKLFAQVDRKSGRLEFHWEWPR